MDDHFPVELWHNDLFWLDAPLSVPILVPVPPLARQISAFAPYLSQPENNPTTIVVAATGSNNSENINKRVIEYWRKHWEAEKAPAAVGDLEREKCHRHMLNERMRREKQRRSYFELHSMLPTKTKVRCFLKKRQNFIQLSLFFLLHF